MPRAGMLLTLRAEETQNMLLGLGIFSGPSALLNTLVVERNPGLALEVP